MSEIAVQPSRGTPGARDVVAMAAALLRRACVVARLQRQLELGVDQDACPRLVVVVAPDGSQVQWCVLSEWNATRPLPVPREGAVLLFGADRQATEGRVAAVIRQWAAERLDKEATG